MRALFAAILTTALPMVVGQRWVSGSPVIRWSLGAVVGIVLIALGAHLGGLAGAPTLGAALMLLFGWIVSPHVNWDAGREPFSPEGRRALLVLVGVGLALLVMSLFRPVPSWDGWFTWSLKSKGLASAGGFDSPVFLSPVYRWSSQEYPTLLPSWQALAYIISGDLTVSWPLQFQQAWLWTAGAVALIALTAPESRAAFLLPLAWVISPQVVWQSIQGYADVPMALLLMLGTAVLWKNRRDPRVHIVSGVLLAGAALTKAEGAPLAIIVLACLLVTKAPAPVLAIAPTLVIAARLPWALFMYVHGISSHMVSLPWVKALVLGETEGRLSEIIITMMKAACSPTRWGILVPACLITALLGRALSARLGAAVLLQMTLIAAVYAISWPYQGASLQDFMRFNVERILIAPLGVLGLAVGLGWSSSVRLPGALRSDLSREAPNAAPSKVS